jgi:two-component system chemotaxis response regulator CheY
MVFLVTDDSRTTRNLIKSYIAELGVKHYTILEAQNAEEALFIIQNHGIDFLLLDWNLTTDMTGLDILKQLRKIDRFKKLPIIMVSSESDRLNVVEALKFGANDFVVKPIDKKSFIEKVTKNLYPS